MRKEVHAIHCIRITCKLHVLVHSSHNVLHPFYCYYYYYYYYFLFYFSILLLTKEKEGEKKGGVTKSGFFLL